MKFDQDDYKGIFEAIESTLIREGSKNLPEHIIRERLDKNKLVEEKVFSDNDYYWVLVYVPFYSGFRSATVSAREKTIKDHFAHYCTVADYDEKRIQCILHDPDMIRNERKIRACVKNARALRDIVQRHGSFQAYIQSFRPTESSENLLRLRADLMRRFSYIGPTTSFHVLTEIGMPVLKPDVVIRRLMYRLGLTQSESTSERELQEVVRQGSLFSQATGHPTRYIDIVLVKYGQVKSEDYGIDRGICTLKTPRCHICGVRELCRYNALQVA